MEFAEQSDTAAAKFSTISILDRARNLQKSRIDAVAYANDYEKLEGMFSEASKSGKLLSKWTPLAKSLGWLSLGADAASLEADIFNSPTDKIPATVARDVTSFAAEAGFVDVGVTAGAAIFGAAFAWTGPLDPFFIAAGGAIGGAGAAYVYNSGIENHVKTSVDSIIDKASGSVSDAMWFITHFGEETSPIFNWAQWARSGQYMPGPQAPNPSNPGQENGTH